RPGPFAAGTASGGRVALPEGAGGGRGGRTDGEEPARRGRPPLPRAEEVACPAGHPGGGRGMTGDPADAADREGRLNAVLLAYLEAAQAGPAPDRGRLLAAHPDLAPELEEFFAGHDVAERLAVTFRDGGLSDIGVRGAGCGSEDGPWRGEPDEAAVGA